MKNREIASKLREIADIMEFQSIEWKPRAYRNAANRIENMSQELSLIYKKDGRKGLESVPAIGERLALHIADFIDKGRVKEWEKFKAQPGKALLKLINIEGLGPSKVKQLSKELDIKNISDLKKAIKQKKLRNLEGFGKKTEQNILQSIKQYESSRERMLIGKAWEIAHEIVYYLKQNADIEKIATAGSLRRMKETIGDIDILSVTNNAKKLMDIFTDMENVSRILVKGDKKSTVVLKEGINVDLRVVKKASYGSALLYFTGSKEHNIELRKLANKKQYKLSEYGLYDKNNKKAAGEKEEDIYKKLELNWIPPELRENMGEIETSRKGNIPELIKLEDVRGDLHVHTNYTDGYDSIRDMVKKAKELGYKYIAITDHSKASRISHGMEKSKIKKQWKEIEKTEKEENIKILKGAEVDILPDGNLDYDESVLSKLDIVLVAVHSRFKSSKKDMTRRLLKALDNEHVNILAHPTGRMINKRQGYEADFDQICNKCREMDIALEINCDPARLDLNDRQLIIAKKHKVKFSFGTDAHTIGSLENIKFGVGQARRAGLEKKDCINALGYKYLKKML